MVSLCAARRQEYHRHQPLFWRIAVDASAQQEAYFAHLLGAGKAIMLVREAAGAWAAS
jgi:hypothetical protein